MKTSQNTKQSKEQTSTLVWALNQYEMSSDPEKWKAQVRGDADALQRHIPSQITDETRWGVTAAGAKQARK